MKRTPCQRTHLLQGFEQQALRLDPYGLANTGHGRDVTRGPPPLVGLAVGRKHLISRAEKPTGISDTLPLSISDNSASLSRWKVRQTDCRFSARDRVKLFDSFSDEIAIRFVSFAVPQHVGVGPCFTGSGKIVLWNATIECRAKRVQRVRIECHGSGLE